VTFSKVASRHGFSGSSRMENGWVLNSSSQKVILGAALVKEKFMEAEQCCRHL
jgi:hypothetical protein